MAHIIIEADLKDTPVDESVERLRQSLFLFSRQLHDHFQIAGQDSEDLSVVIMEILHSKKLVSGVDRLIPF